MRPPPGLPAAIEQVLREEVGESGAVEITDWNAPEGPAKMVLKKLKVEKKPKEKKGRADREPRATKAEPADPGDGGAGDKDGSSSDEGGPGDPKERGGGRKKAAARDKRPKRSGSQMVARTGSQMEPGPGAKSVAAGDAEDGSAAQSPGGPGQRRGSVAPKGEQGRAPLGRLSVSGEGGLAEGALHVGGDPQLLRPGSRYGPNGGGRRSRRQSRLSQPGAGSRRGSGVEPPSPAVDRRGSDDGRRSKREKQEKVCCAAHRDAPRTMPSHQTCPWCPADRPCPMRHSVISAAVAPTTR